MRIGFEYLLPGARDSGVEVAIRELLRAHVELLSDRDSIDLWVSSHTPQDELPPSPTLRPRVSSLASLGRVGRVAWQQLGAAVALRRFPVDVYHATGYVASPLLPVPTVVSIYDTIALDRSALTRLLNAAHYRLAVPRGVRHAAAVAVPSEHVKHRLVAALDIPEDKIHVIPLGVSERFARISPALARKRIEHLPIPADVPFVLFVGNVERKKNLGILLDAFAALLQDRGSDIRLVMAGSPGDDAAAVARRIRELGLDGRAILCGYVPDDTLVALYSAARFVVYPSADEGFGFPPLEAMACGTPAICSSAGALPETVGSAALLVEPGDVHGLVAAMRALNDDDSLRVAYTQRGLVRVAGYTWRACASKMMALYQSIATSSVRADQVPEGSFP